MEPQWPAHRPDRSSPYRGGAAPGYGAWNWTEGLDVFAGADEPAPARARYLPPGGVRRPGPGAAGPGRVGLRPLRGSDLETDRGDPTELVPLARWWTRRRDGGRCRAPRGPRDRRGPPGWPRRAAVVAPAGTA